MEYITRNLTSDPGMDQREALVALQTHPSFKAGSVVASIRRRNDQWVAEVLEPKEAGEDAPDKDGGDEGGGEAPPKAEGPPAPSDPDGDGDNDSSPSGDTDKDFAGAPGDEKKPGGDDKPEGKGSTDEMILHTLTQILHALQGGGAPDVAGGPDALGPGGPPGGPPAPKAPAPPAGGPPPVGKGAPAGKIPPRPMKPGDTPPGGTPVGAPAFASVQSNQPLPLQPAQGTPVPTGTEPGPVGQPTAGVCPQDGNPEPCPVHSGAGVGGLNQAVASYSGRAATITLTHEGTDIKAAIEQARPVVENYGYKVKQAKHSDDGTKIHILASRR